MLTVDELRRTIICYGLAVAVAEEYFRDDPDGPRLQRAVKKEDALLVVIRETLELYRPLVDNQVALLKE